MEKKYVILCDNSCEFSEDVRKKYDIEVILGHFTTPDGKEHQAFLDWNEWDRDKFYQELKKNPNGFKTSPPSIDEYKVCFESYVKEGLGILAIALSTGISGSHSFMVKAKEEVLAKYPNAEIEIIDSLRFGPGYGLIAIEASLRRAKGATLSELAKWIEENKNCYHQTGWMDDLSFVAKKGRLTHAKAFFGSLVGVKPIGEFDYNGLTTVIGKAKGEKQAFQVLLEYMARHIVNPEEQIIIVATSNRQKQANMFCEMIKERFHPKDVFVNDIYSSCGINIGPGLMAAYYYGKPISHGLVEETKVLSEILSKTKE